MKKWLNFDWLSLVPALFLTIFSIILLATLSPEKHLAIYQGIFFICGLILFYVFDRLYFQALFPLRIYLYIFGILLLILVLIFGETKFGSSRWINLGFFAFQPSEIFKIILIIFLIKFIADKKKFNIKDYLAYLGFLLLPFILVAKEPDLGSALVYLFLGMVIYFFSQRERRFFYITLGLIIIILPLIYNLGLKEYQKERIKVFLNPKSDIMGEGYNIWQSIIAVGSGGIKGKGIGKGSQSQLQFLPIRYADFIYATGAEATGFIGSVVILGLYFWLIFRIFWIAFRCDEESGYLLGIGIGAVFLVQVFINIGMNLGIMPVTGLPLVFLSYGGSSLISSYIMLGIVSNLSRRGQKMIFKDL